MFREGTQRIPSVLCVLWKKQGGNPALWHFICCDMAVIGHTQSKADIINEVAIESLAVKP